jgi:hypothetical protein
MPVKVLLMLYAKLISTQLSVRVFFRYAEITLIYGAGAVEMLFAVHAKMTQTPLFV